MTRRQRALRGSAHALVCAAIFSAASAKAAGPETDAVLDEQAVVSTNQLLGTLRQYERAPAAQRAGLADQLAQIAARRRATLLALFERNPKAAALRVLPAAVRTRLPASVQSAVEQAVSISGSVAATIGDDFARGRSTTQLHLHRPGAQPLDLRVAGATERETLALVGKRGTIHAVQLGQQLLVLDKNRLELQAAGATTGTSSSTTTATSTGVVQGVQNTLVIMANFSDKPIACTPADLQSRLFGTATATMNDGYRQSSGGLVSFTGKVVGPFPINFASTGTCDYNGWATAMNAAAVAAGFNPANYQRVSYAMPGNPSCGWTGLASLGGTPPTSSWIQSCGETGVFSHELGHNLMLTHASTPTSEYGDFSDPMGAALLVQSNAANRVMAGWMSAGQVADIKAGGSYALGAIESATLTAPQVLRLVKADTAEFYYLSMREATGIDAGLPSVFKNSVSVHRATGTMPARTYLMATLAAGQSFADSVNGIQIVNQGGSGSAVSVSVSFNGATCTRQAPSVTAGPASQTGTPGSSLAYSVHVVNNNSLACPSSTFGLTQALPSGFSGSFGTPSVALAPGAAADIAWTVSSAASSTDATYTLAATASESAVSNSAVDQAGYIVLAAPAPSPAPAPAPAPSPAPADTTPPTVTITSPLPASTLSGSRTVITANAADNSGVSAVEFYVDGALLTRDTAAPFSASWNTRKLARGNHAIRVRAIDTFGNAAEQTISVTR